ncbi:hypothetical protein R1flu_021981 [Riccia fluitans]|uniref:Uncharacterized protein n=1 Tax=Riccia fluitans TaxID=41844 RepID=A0ABD1ZR43_9MARC
MSPSENMDLSEDMLSELGDFCFDPVVNDNLNQIPPAKGRILLLKMYKHFRSKMDTFGILALESAVCMFSSTGCVTGVSNFVYPVEGVSIINQSAVYIKG